MSPPSRVAACRPGVPGAAALKGIFEAESPAVAGRSTPAHFSLCVKTGRHLWDGCCRLCGRKCERREKK